MVGVASAIAFSLAGCVRVSNGTWYLKSASTPEGWPELTPVGEVEVKTYPVYRAASVTNDNLGNDGRKPMFMELFRHIRKNDIAMTAPVDMTYDSASPDADLTSMAFLYGDTEMGAVGDDGVVVVRDLTEQTFASVGVRGNYNARTYARGHSDLMDWFDENPQWRPEGEPRYLGYNGPFVPAFWRYGEVQIQVEPADAE